MAAGLPVITTSIRGCRELVEPGRHGWIVPPRRPQALAAALREAASAPAQLLDALGRAAYARADSRHREHLVFDRLVQGYAELGFPPG
jgi:glycosyltransferase involved in cell wall biosynthesis